MQTTLPLVPAIPRSGLHRGWWLNALAFGIGLISFLYVNVVGQLYVVELMLPLLLLLLWASKYRLILQKSVARVLLFGLLWLLAQVATDLIRGTPMHDLMRGWAAIIIFLTEFAVVYMLVSEQEDRLYALMLGVALGGVLQQFIQPSSYFHDQPWKFGFGPPLAMLLVAWLGMRYRNRTRIRILPVLAMLAFGALSIYLNARSLGGFVALTALLVWFRGTPVGRHVMSRRLRPGRMIILATAVFAFGLGVVSSYGYAVSHGWLGQKAFQKYKMDASGRLGLVLGGRANLIPAVFAVMDSPVIGHGSWAKDPRYRKYLLLLLSLGYDRSKGSLEGDIAHSDLIPAHSHILQAWVWAGVMGAVFWLIVLSIVLKSMFLSYRRPNPYYIPVLFMGLNDLWNIFLSPFGAMMRFHWVLTLTLFLMALKYTRQRKIFEGALS
jgi:hypothetical protein